ncbi:MAG: glycosyltransferase family 4 protein, partial [Syntrophales bacterium]|nr:glycosyltransferase family 4 protein [Syntrophales bacterium]
MRILMFGWEFPPHISGGLGTACYGMTKALTDLGQEIIFVIPALDGSEKKTHVHLVSAAATPLPDTAPAMTPLERLMVKTIPSPLHPYMTDLQYQTLLGNRGPQPGESYLAVSGVYGRNLMDEVRRYSLAAGTIAAGERFDVIHGHDWMTVPACVAAKKASGRPFVLHIHALEFDRSGEQINQAIYDMERLGMEAADTVIAVSHYTKNMIVSRYGIAPDKISVIHNAVTRTEGGRTYHAEHIPSEKVILFMGRITFQKGPTILWRPPERSSRKCPKRLSSWPGRGR